MTRRMNDGWDRRRVLNFMGVAAGTTLAMPALHLSRAGATQPAIPEKTVRLAMVNVTNHSVFVLGTRKGYFDEVGIKIVPDDGRTIFENQTVPVLQTGEVDIASIFLGVLTPVLHQVTNIKTFINTSFFQGNTILTGPNTGFKTVDEFVSEGMNFKQAAKATMEQLRGQKITVPTTIATRPWLEFVYSFGGLKLEDSDLIIVEDPNAVQLAVSGQVPFASPAGAVQIYQLENQAGWKPLMSTRQMVKHAGGPDGAPVNRILNYDGFACTTEYLNANRDTIHRFNSVIYRTMEEIFGPNQMAILAEYAPFINSINGSSLDAGAIKFIFEEMDPFFRWEDQERLWTDKSYPLEYHNVYEYQIHKFIEDGTLPAGQYPLEDMLPSKDIWLEARAMKANAEQLLDQAETMNLPSDKGALVETGREWIAKYNFLDAVNVLKAAIS